MGLKNKTMGLKTMGLKNKIMVLKTMGIENQWESKRKKTINKGLMIDLNKLAKINEEECNKIIAKILMLAGVL